jgi:hypothetical protein
MDSNKTTRDELHNLALKLLRLEDEIAECGELHRQEFGTLEERINELRAQMLRVVPEEPEPEPTR